MNKSYGPIDVGSALGDIISDAVVRFAKANNLDYELWYHDEPIWLVGKMRANRALRVQIGAFRIEPEIGTQLLFIAEAYTVDETKKHLDLMADDKVEGSIISVKLKEIAHLPSDDVGIRLEKLLGEAWQKAEGLLAEPLEIRLDLD